MEEQHLSILGTLRRDGWSRVSPCEVYFVDGELMLGMMLGSRKALDLQRDPRIPSSTASFKIYGRATEIFDKPRRDALADAQGAAIDWRPTDPFHVFTVDILSAAFISFGDDHRAMSWSPERGLERLRHPDD